MFFEAFAHARRVILTNLGFRQRRQAVDRTSFERRSAATHWQFLGDLMLRQSRRMSKNGIFQAFAIGAADASQ
jgi:hypothetical protein